MSKLALATLILYQRTGLQRLGKSRLARRVLPYRWAVFLDACCLGSSIIRRYRDLVRSEWEDLLPHVPPEATRILDLGCGIGGIHEFSWKTYSAKGPTRLYLADRNRVDGDVYYGFAPTPASYNSLRLTRGYLAAQGVHPEAIETFDIEKDPLPESVAFDLVMSTLSWGYHYPVATYLDYVTKHLSPTGTVILDCRVGTEGREALSQYFDVTAIGQSRSGIRLRCRNR